MVKVKRTSTNLKALAQNVSKGSPKVVAGVLAGATRDVDDGALEKSVPVAPYAAYMEFGTATVPPRPFLRTSLAEHGKEWTAVLKARIHARNGDVRAAMNDCLNLVRTDIVQTIAKYPWTPLEASTIAEKRRKGRPNPAQPLQDTRSLIKSISAEVIG